MTCLALASVFLVASCGTSNVSEFLNRDPVATVTSTMNYARLGECLWNIEEKKRIENKRYISSRDRFYITRFHNDIDEFYRLNRHNRSGIWWILVIAPTDATKQESTVKAYTEQGLLGAAIDLDEMRASIHRCETADPSPS